MYEKKVNLSDHQKIRMSGYELFFPFSPYDVQSDYMQKVLTAIKNGENALLESPTGTGKTLCLLTAAIAALKQERDKDDGKVWDRSNETEKSKIIYTSRTFSQLKQVLRELKKTVYKLDVVLVGSRDQLCVNEKINHQ